MRTFYKTLLLTLLLYITGASMQAYAQDPITEIIKAGVTKVIVATDLQIQRIQNETIWLQNAQKVLENKLSELRLAEIAQWTERQRVLYADYYRELWEIKSAIAHYQQVRDIIRKQAALLAECKRAYHLFKQDDNFSSTELAYMYRVYTGILEESVKHLDQVLLVVSSFSTQMSDGKRLELIHHAASSIAQNYSDLREFNAQNVLLSLQRAKERNNLQVVQKLYGISSAE